MNIFKVLKTQNDLDTSCVKSLYKAFHLYNAWKSGNLSIKENEDVLDLLADDDVFPETVDDILKLLGLHFISIEFEKELRLLNEQTSI